MLQDRRRGASGGRPGLYPSGNRRFRSVQTDSGAGVWMLPGSSTPAISLAGGAVREFRASSRRTLEQSAGRGPGGEAAGPCGRLCPGCRLCAGGRRSASPCQRLLTLMPAQARGLRKRREIEGARLFARIRWIPSGFGKTDASGSTERRERRPTGPLPLGKSALSERRDGFRRRGLEVARVFDAGYFAGRREAAEVPGIEPQDPRTVRRPRPGRRSRKASRSALSGLPAMRRRPEVRLPLSASVDVDARPSPRPAETAGNRGRAASVRRRVRRAERVR